jgi:hypothetical protein
MSSYDIKGWNVVMFNNSTTKVPMIYVKPDVTFKEFAEKNSYAVVCEISGTGTIYDGKRIPGVVDKSCFVLFTVSPDFISAKSPKTKAPTESSSRLRATALILPFEALAKKGVMASCHKICTKRQGFIY